MANLINIMLFILIIIVPCHIISNKRKNIIAIIMLSIFLHQFIAFYNTQIGTVIGAHADAARFQNQAVKMALLNHFTFNQGAGVYMYFLGKIYSIFGASHYLGCQLSILMILFSTLLILQFCRLLTLNTKETTAILAIFSLLPTILLIGSVTLREPYEIFFFMSCVFTAIRFTQSNKPRYLGLFVVSLFTLSLLHQALPIISFLILLLSCAYWTINMKNKKNILIVVGAIVLIFIIATPIYLHHIYIHHNAGKMSLQALSQGKIIDYVSSYRSHTIREAGRTTYKVFIEDKNIFTLLYSIIKVYLAYIILPLPWQITNVSDLFASLESTIRVLLILSTIYQLVFVKSHRHIYTYLLLSYILMSGVWSMGTANYGTAIRHHLLTDWILYLTGTPTFLEIIRKHFSKRSINNART